MTLISDTTINPVLYVWLQNDEIYYKREQKRKTKTLNKLTKPEENQTTLLINKHKKKTHFIVDNHEKSQISYLVFYVWFSVPVLFIRVDYKDWEIRENWK